MQATQERDQPRHALRRVPLEPQTDSFMNQLLGACYTLRRSLSFANSAVTTSRAMDWP